jgi:preprotein translocase SecF subunit
MAKFGGEGLVVLQKEEVGPQVGKELKMDAIWAILLSLVGMIIYISWRFEFGFALGGIVALVHDVLFTAGVYVLCGRQITLQTVAVLLTIIGYSINDTIVIFDRIREDIRLIKNKSFTEICNISVNETLARTIITNLTVFITVVMLLVFGGGAINDFALALFIGMIAGTYSTVFIATPVVLGWHRGKTPDLGKPATPAK